MSVAAAPAVGEREVDHRSQQQRRGERVLRRERVGRWGQKLVMVSVQLFGAGSDRSRGSV